MLWTPDQKFRNWLPGLQSHRGYWVGGLTQNSLESIQESFAKKYHIVEFDVRLTKDQKVILFHDETLGKNFNDQRIDQISLQQLQNLIQVNTLEHILDWFRYQPDHLKLNIELKTKDILNRNLEKTVSDLIENYQVSERVLISSFNPFSLVRFRFLNPTVYRALIQTFEQNSLNYWFIKQRIFNFFCKPHALHLRFEDWNEIKYQRLSQKIPIVLWTLNDLNLYLKIKDKVFGVITDTITPDDLKD